MTQNKKNLALLGGSGFVGSEMTRQMNRDGGYDIIVGDIQNVSEAGCLWLNSDVRDLEQVKAACKGAEVICNLAAEHRDDVRPISLYDEVNIDGARIVCEAAEELGIKRMVFTSSVAVYGFPDGEPDETAPHNYFNDYGRTKSLAEDVYKAWAEKDPERTLVIVRPTVIFGPDNRGNVYNLLKQINSRLFVMIGSGKNKKSMAYVGNISKFLIQALNHEPGIHIYNYVDKPDLTMNELVRTVRKALGKDNKSLIRVPYAIGWLGGLAFDILAAITRKTFPISRIRVKKFCSNTVFNADKAMNRPGFQQDKTLSEALTETIQHEFLDR